MVRDKRNKRIIFYCLVTYLLAVVIGLRTWRELVIKLLLLAVSIGSLTLNCWLCCQRSLNLSVIHCICYLLLKLHLNPALIIRMKNVHCLKVQRANTSHESFLQVFLHQGFVAMLIFHYCVGLIKLIAERFNFFVVLSTDMLEFEFHGLIKILSILNYFPRLVLLLPPLECLTGKILFILPSSMLQYSSRMDLEVSVFLQCIKSIGLNELYTKESFSFSRPQSHHLTPCTKLIMPLGLGGQRLFQLLNLVLLNTKESIETTSLCIESLG